MLAPSCVAALDILINGQALSTQAQRDALTHLAIRPLLVLLLLMSSITSLRALAELFSRYYPSSNAHALPVYKTKRYGTSL